MYALLKVADCSPGHTASIQESSSNGKRGDKKALERAMTVKVKPYRANHKKEAALSDRARALLSGAQKTVTSGGRKILEDWKRQRAHEKWFDQAAKLKAQSQPGHRSFLTSGEKMKAGLAHQQLIDHIQKKPK